MKRTLIESIPEPLPAEIERFIGSARVFDSSCSPCARVYFIDRDGGYFLKLAPRESLAAEAGMAKYFHSKNLSAEVLSHQSLGERDLLLTARVAGEDCTHAQYLDDPKRLCDILGTKLRELHEIDASDCPVQSRMDGYIAWVEQNYRTDNYDKSHFPDSFGYRSGDEAYEVFSQGKSLLKNEVLLHGDYCLPNVILDDWRFSGFIDLGNGGVGDRHVDLFWGAWTLMFNLGTDKYRDRFFDAYGRDRLEPEKIKIIAAAEVFG